MLLNALFNKKNSTAEQKEKSAGDFPALSFALKVLCQERFALALKITGTPLLYFFDSRLGPAVDHSRDDLLHHVGWNVLEVVLRKVRHIDYFFQPVSY
jgi:hypothetical protein